ncbi:MAG: solute carrier family 23 protein, partial [Bacilli bacterium]|nr:solute carrier family 23 protein [Bacilli bacterium]
SQIGITSDSTLEWKGLIVALVTFLTTAIITIKGKGFIKIIPFFIGIVSGYVAAIILGMVDFRLVAEAPFFGVPNLIIPFKDYTPVASGLLIIIPVAIVTIAEHIGDHTVLGEIIGKDLIKDPGLDRTLMGDGLATFIAGLVGGPANTTYGENTGVVGMTKVASIIVIIGAAIISIILAFFAKFTAIVSTIPGQVLGGVSLLLYGFIAINGLKVLIKNKIDFDKPKNIIIASSMLVLGLGGAALSFVSGDFSLTISGMSLACIVGIVINLLINEDEKAK